MNARDAILFGVRRLAGHRCDGADAARETEALLAFAARRTREDLLVRSERPLGRAVEKKFRGLVARRRRHEPLAHLLGTAWFMGREFRVTPETLVPRPATESLLEAALEGMGAVSTAIDVGTGSGCIAVTLAHALPDATVVATDVSSAALRAARTNAARQRVRGRIAFKKGDLLAPVRHVSSGPTLIVANLPYVPAGMWRKLSPDIRRFEPKSALVSGRDGLDASRRLVDQLAALQPSGGTRIAFEILPRQYAPLAAYAKRHLDGRTRRIRNLAGITVGLVIDIA